MRYRAGLIVACCSLLALVSCDRPDEASAAKAPASPNPPAAASAPTAPWQYQLQGPVDTGVNAGTFVVDGFDVDQPTVADLHRRGRTVICYVNAGAREEWRPDAARYPADIVGADLARLAEQRYPHGIEVLQSFRSGNLVDQGVGHGGKPLAMPHCKMQRPQTAMEEP